ncbi:hypothetical protein [Hydrogenophaga sp. PAMC20947]|uniref:hypothetical protein n=1 Tax=Hydrogenophaga sp. PAMC20947 TaxID=2565558 RepID=UPI001444CC29|nr:hypothetical protein [Hydrogenophaga sp. PAMC20947]
MNAAFLPSSAINAAAEEAYADFRRAALEHLDTPGATPADIGAATTGFSRGCATAIRFAQLVNERGLVGPDGAVIAPPGSVPITGMALIDPVARFVEGPMHIPPNVRGQVLTVMAEHENRTDFRPLYYGDDPRVTTVRHPGNHVGVGGGYDRHGTAANVLEGVTGYFQQRGVALADVPPDRRHDPARPQHLYTEAYSTARNGDVLAREDGAPVERWRLDDPRQGRIEVRPLTPPAHAIWLRQLERDIGPGLRAAGITPEQCQTLAQACAHRSGQEGVAAPPQRLLLSKDHGRVGWLDSQGRLAEVRIDQALAAPGLAQGSVQDPSLAQGRTPVNGAHSPNAPAVDVDQAPVIEALVRSR